MYGRVPTNYASALRTIVFLIRLLDALEVVVPFAAEKKDGRELPAFLAEVVQLGLRGGGSIGDQDFVFDLVHGIGF